MSQEDAKLHPLRGRVAEALRAAPSRRCQGEPVNPQHRPLQVSFSNAHERATVGIAVLLLEHIRELGGSCSPAKTLQALSQRTLSTMTPEERQDIEIEVHAIISWLGESLAPELSPSAHIPATVHANLPRRDVIRWAIAHGHDLQVEYYDSKRGELTAHKLTPMALEADDYLRAISHLTKAEVVFELTHLSELRPDEGWPVHHTESPIPPAYPYDEAREPVARRASPLADQMSLLGEEE